MQVCDNSLCTGCGVCADACPTGCINIEYDNNGFLQSYVDDDKCIGCNKCKKVCSALNPNINNQISRAYKIRRNDNEAIIDSTSGGVAALISEYIISNGGVVVGCGFDDNLVLKHSVAENPLELEAFKGSKYVQSKTRGIYREVKDLLKLEKTVLFIGTPCQTSALQNFLGQNYDNLYIIDLVCHGVSSQKALDKYIEYIEHKTNESVISVKFRNKDKGYTNGSGNYMQYILSDGVETESYQSGFGLWFAADLSIRESCYKCNFVSTKRSSDLTLADYNVADFSEEESLFGASTVFVNSDKGSLLLNKIENSANIKDMNLDSCIKRCTRLYQYSNRPRLRNRFFADLNKKDAYQLSKIYSMRKILPCKVVLYIRAIEKRILRILNRKR